MELVEEKVGEIGEDTFLVIEKETFVERKLTIQNVAFILSLISTQRFVFAQTQTNYNAYKLDKK